MPRPRVNFESMLARFAAGTLARIDAARWPHETRTEFVQRAVEQLIRVRGGAPSPAGGDPAQGKSRRQGDADW